MPVPSVLGRVGRHHHFVADPGGDLMVAPRAAVGLDRLVRLHVADLDRTVGRAPGAHVVPQPKTAQSTSAAVTTSATATITMSLLRFAWERNGLRPTPLR